MGKKLDISLVILSIILVSSVLGLWQLSSQKVAARNKKLEGVLETLKRSYQIVEASLGTKTPKVTLYSLEAFEAQIRKHNPATIFFSRYAIVGGGSVWFWSEGLIYLYSIS